MDDASGEILDKMRIELVFFCLSRAFANPFPWLDQMFLLCFYLFGLVSGLNVILRKRSRKRKTVIRNKCYSNASTYLR